MSEKVMKEIAKLKCMKYLSVNDICQIKDIIDKSFNDLRLMLLDSAEKVGGTHHKYVAVRDINQLFTRTGIYE